MRMHRRLALGLTMLAVLPSLSSAQANRNFEDAWFWGIKAGGMTYWTNRVAHATAPLFGAEWLITRKRAGLYVAFDQALFKAKATVVAGQTSVEPVNIKNMRRLTGGLFAFPVKYGGLRPYAGVGLALNWLQESNFTSTAPGDTAIAINEDAKSVVTPVMLLGLQAQYRRFSVFGQGSYVPSGQTFLLSGNELYFFEGGIRINIGSSREKF
jgi:hypothetical protein